MVCCRERKVNQVKNFRKSYGFSSIAFILVGLALLLWPALSLRLVCGLFGLVILIKGISSLVGYARSEVRTVFHYFGWVFGAAATALGVFLLIKPETVVSVLPILVGLFVIFDGVMRIQSALELRNAGYHKWWSFLLLALLSAGLGVLILWNPFATVEVLVMVIGIILMVEGVLNLGGSLYASWMLRGLQKAAEQATEEFDRMLDGETDETAQGTVIDVEYRSVDDE